MRILPALLVGALILSGCTTYRGPEGDPTPYVPVENRTSTTPSSTTTPQRTTTTSQTATPKADVPVWSVGDSWTYRTTQNGGPQNITERVVAIESINVGGQNYQAYKVEATLGSTNMTLHVRQSDFARLKATTNSNGIVSTLTYDKPCVTRHFPITVGAKWSYSCTYSTAVSGPSGSTTLTTTEFGNVTVIKEQAVAVAAGTFAAFFLEESSSTTVEGRSSGIQVRTEVFAQAACKTVQVRDGNGATTSELQLYRCGGK